MSRFVLIDPSLTEHGGDRWQYAVDSAHAARERGLKFIILANRNAPSIQGVLPFAIEERRVFDYAFWEHGRVYDRHRALQQSDEDNRWNKRLDEDIGRLDKRIESARSRGDICGRMALESLKSARLWSAQCRGLAQRFRARSRLVPRPFNRDQFAEALADALRELSLGEGDHVFFHMTTYGMLESLAETNLALGHAKPCEATADFILHFGKDASDARTFLDRYSSYSAYGSIADRLVVGSPFRKMRFLATSPLLQDEASAIIGAPVGRWHGLVDIRRLERILGSAGEIAALRRQVAEEFAVGRVTFIARAVDLDVAKARAVSRACHLVQHRGAVIHLKLLYTKDSLPKLRDLLGSIDFPNVDLVNADDNDNYIRVLASATLVMLIYDVEKYAKRVSGVLHDCAVLGVPAMVPAGSTLQACEFASTFVYHSLDDLLGATLNATRRLARDPDSAARMVSLAREAVGGNILDRLERNAPASITRRAARAPIANVVMPLWGRVGSSFAMEGQVRYLLQRGYFVNQVFLMDKPVDELESFEYFWKMLRENSQNTRGCVQRIGYVDESRANQGRNAPSYLKADAFDQFLRRIARSTTGDDIFDRSLMRADVTIVNHVFHAKWALANTGGRKVLETHDIQSYGMMGWPLLNDATGRVDDIKSMLASELEMIKRFDHVVNVSPEEHRVLSLANSAASLITPWIPERRSKARFGTIAEMARHLGWHESYQTIQRFDMLIIGDAHSSNVDSITWFIERVFKPFLSPRGITLAIAGRVSDVIYKRGISLPYLMLVGFVEDLESLKSLTRLAILPDQRGTGISIKTLDAFASGMPFVATRVALRGLLDRLPPDCRSVDDPAEFADHVLEALREPDQLPKLENLARRCYEAVASEHSFNEGWDRVFERLGLAPPLRAFVKTQEPTTRCQAANILAK